MKLGTEKFRTTTIRRGKLVTNDKTVEINNEEIITKALMEEETYKYLGIEQRRMTEEMMIKEKLQKEFQARIQAVCRTGLNAGNLIKAINTYAVTTLTYSFGIVKWSETEMEELQRMTRKYLTKNRQHHPESAIERTLIRRSEGGRGILDIASLKDRQIASTNKYMQHKANESSIIEAVVRTDEGLTPVDMNGRDRLDIEEIVKTRNEARMATWKNKTLHGRFDRESNAEEVDKEMSCIWFRKRYTFPELEEFMFAIQDQMVSTRNYRKVILKDWMVEDKCRKRGKDGETIQHVLNGREALVTREYKERLI